MEDYTQLQQQVIAGLVRGDDYEGYPTQCIQNLIDETGLNAKVLRGVLSTLIQRGAVLTGQFSNGMTAFHLVEN
jgi:DNA-binding transcriptional regulator YhcF (GntR family)